MFAVSVANAPDTEYVTTDFWRYTPADRTLKMTNGWTATYEQGNYPGGVMLVEVHDEHGNSLTPSWEVVNSDNSRPSRMTAVQQVLGGQTRTVTFSYDTHPPPFVSWMPNKMTYNDGHQVRE